MTSKIKKSNLSLYRSSLRKDRSSIISRDRRSSITVTSFDAVFKHYWSKLCTSLFPRVNIAPKEPLGGDFSKFNVRDSLTAKSKKNGVNEKNEEKPSDSITLIYESHESQLGLNSVIMKNLKLERCMLIALRKTLQKLDVLKVLKLEFCNLQNTDIRILKSILLQSPFIRTLSINGNPNPFQNFYVLIKNTQLSQICLRFCQINDRGVALIAKQLKVYEHPLLFLDLSSNYVSDIGVNSVCEALRINRSLLSLNLADNWITDVGCLAVMSILTSFPLEHEECVIRRRRVVELFRARENELEEQKNNLLASLAPRKSTQETPKIKERSSKGKNKRVSSSVHAASVSTISVIPNVKKDANFQKGFQKIVIDMIISVIMNDAHPFVRDSTVKDNELTCKGNLTLLNLNLSYNKISSKARFKIIETLLCQKEIGKGNAGLTELFLVGNPVQEDCVEVNYVNCLRPDVQGTQISRASIHRSPSIRRKSKSKTSRRRSANI